VVPLTVLGLLAGLAGVVLVRASGGARLVLPAAGAAVSGAALLAALLLPGLLGPAYRVWRERDPVDPAAIRVVPLPGRTTDSGPENPDWVDASRAALQQSGLRVQVVGASVGPTEARAILQKKAPNKKGAAAEALFIRVRARRAEDARSFAADVARQPDRPDEAHRPTLTDNTGKVYRERPAPSAPEGVGKSSRFPVTVVEEVFAFEAPPPGLECLRLEVPAAAWGGSGAFRFTIPAAMIERQPPGGPARAGRRPGG
jgi:hypothetical protein